jgi:hypothetical protein
MMTKLVSSASLEAIEATLARHFSGTLASFTKDLMRLEPIEDLGYFTKFTDKKEFKARARAIYIWLRRGNYCAARTQQLKESGFSFWVYRSYGCPDHGHIDGLALPPEHPFWLICTPSNSWGCICCVLGARSPAGVKRLGGDIAKMLPIDWKSRTSDIDSAWYLAPEFRSSAHPDLRTCLQALDAGHHHTI